MFLWPDPDSPAASLLNIDDSGTGRPGFPSLVVVTTRVHLLVVLSPPLLAELVARRLAALDVDVAVADAAPVPEGHYDVVVRNVAVPTGVSGDLVVDLQSPDRAAPPPATPLGEPVSVDRVDDVAELLVSRWPSLER
jgi:hypothetical protein